jgi:transcription initiation factor TFIIH subunit 2
MVASDDDYVEGSDDDIVVPSSSRDAQSGTRSKSTRANKESSGFEVTRTWENLTEGADGTITSTVEGLLQAGKRQRSSIPQSNSTASGVNIADWSSADS